MTGINLISVNESTIAPLLFNLKVVFPFLSFLPPLELSTKRQRDLYFLLSVCAQLPLVLMGVKCLLWRKTDPKV